MHLPCVYVALCGHVHDGCMNLHTCANACVRCINKSESDVGPICIMWVAVLRSIMYMTYSDTSTVQLPACVQGHFRDP